MGRIHSSQGPDPVAGYVNTVTIAIQGTLSDSFFAVYGFEHDTSHTWHITLIADDCFAIKSCFPFRCKYLA
jgi:hypothetical protein